MQTQTTPKDAFVVTVIREPAKEVTFGDVIISALGVTGVLVILSLVLAAVLALVLVKWRQRHPPGADHLPSISPLVPGQAPPPSSPTP
jgi:hypothetical protein